MAVKSRDYRSLPSSSSLQNAKRIAKKAPAGIRELGLIHRNANKFRRGFARAKLNDAEGKKIEGWLPEGSIFRSEGDPLRSIGTTRTAHTANTITHTHNTLIGWMFMAEREYSIQ